MGVAATHARRTERLGNVIRLVGYSTGGLPGSRLLDRLAIHISDDTILRVVKSSPPRPDGEAIHHLGVDDWAWRRGQNYGTILVDLERRRVVDLLPDRSAKSLESWLSQRPTIQTLNRDRCGTYAEGTANGAPEAVQIADRFHLVLNFSEAVERVLENHRQELELPALNADHRIAPDAPAACAKPETAAQRVKSARRCRRLERYQRVIELHQSGHSQQAIGEALCISRKTVRRWLRSGKFPERKPPSGRHSHLREFDEYLRQRWAKGCHNATQLFREIRARGYRSSRQMVSYHLSSWRADRVSKAKASPAPCAQRRRHPHVQAS
jgi:transposase